MFPGVQGADGHVAANSAPSNPVAQAAGGKSGKGRSRFPRGWSLIKIGVGFAFVFVAGSALMLQGSTVASSNAVVSSYKVVLRSPIEGIVSGISAKVGDALPAGQQVGRIDEVRVSDQRLVDLRENVARWAAEKASYQRQEHELTTLMSSLDARSQAWKDNSRRYMDDVLKEAEETEAARRSRLEVARKEAARRMRLNNAGYASNSDFDKYQGEAEALERELKASAAHLGAIRERAKAEEAGVIVDSGSSDKIYSEQRADEVAIRLTEVRRAVSSFEAQEAEAAARLKEEEARLARYRSTELSAPSAGIVWRVDVSNGERVSIADPVMELVNCQASFIIAAVPQDRFGDILIGARATYRLSGDDLDRHGIVQSVTGQATLAEERNLAAAPMVQRSAVAMARISLEQPEKPSQDCSVGRTLRILLPVRRTNLFDAIQRWFD